MRRILRRHADLIVFTFLRQQMDHQDRRQQLCLRRVVQQCDAVPRAQRQYLRLDPGQELAMPGQLEIHVEQAALQHGAIEAAADHGDTPAPSPEFTAQDKPFLAGADGPDGRE